MLNPNEGIIFANILSKHVTDDMIQNEIRQGLMQFGDTYSLTAFKTDHIAGRKYKGTGNIQLASGTKININLNLS